MRKLKALIASLLFSLPVLVPITASAQFNSLDPACQEVQGTSEICTTAEAQDDPIKGDRSVFVVIANFLTLAAGAIAVTMIVISGITMITSSGDAAKVKKSRDTMLYSVVGIFVVILSRSIILFILGRIAG